LPYGISIVGVAPNTHRFPTRLAVYFTFSFTFPFTHAFAFTFTLSSPLCCQVRRARPARLLPPRLHDGALQLLLLGRDHLQGPHVQGELCAGEGQRASPLPPFSPSPQAPLPIPRLPPFFVPLPTFGGCILCPAVDRGGNQFGFLDGTCVLVLVTPAPVLLRPWHLQARQQDPVRLLGPRAVDGRPVPDLRVRTPRHRHQRRLHRG
jgi:hypothetical protein